MTRTALPLANTDAVAAAMEKFLDVVNTFEELTPWGLCMRAAEVPVRFAVKTSLEKARVPHAIHAMDTAKLHDLRKSLRAVSTVSSLCRLATTLGTQAAALIAVLDAGITALVFAGTNASLRVLRIIVQVRTASRPQPICMQPSLSDLLAA